MKSYSVYLFFIIIICGLLVGCKQASKLESNDWTPIFNGKNLEGWTPKIKGEAFGSDSLNTFKVENGNLKVSYENYDQFENRFGHLFYKTPYSNYKLKLHYRFVGEQIKGGEAWAEKNSGIMIHSQDPATMELHQDFPNSLEFQLLGGITDSIPRPTGSLCTPGTHVYINDELITKHCITAQAPSFYNEEWVEAEVEVYRDSLIRHYINGQPVITYTKPINDLPNDSLNHMQALTSGYISLQSESHPIEFKNIQLMIK
jgi:hypothetical protein